LPRHGGLARGSRPLIPGLLWREEVKSLGAKFVKIDLGETGQTKNGYANALTAEQLEKQRQEIAKYCATADVVITTAQIFGKKAPLIVTRDMIAAMKKGSIIVRPRGRKRGRTWRDPLRGRT